MNNQNVKHNLCPVVIHKKCQICGSANLNELYMVCQRDFSYIMNLCKNCSHIQVGKTQLPPEQKQEQSDYFCDIDLKNEQMEKELDTQWGDLRLKAFKNILKNLEKMGFEKGRVLDVGSAFGHMLNIAQKMGYEVLGVEPSPSAREFALKKFGVESVSHISDISDSFTFDIILCMETLYYLHDIRQMLYDVGEKISPNGCFVLKMRCNRTNLFRIAAKLNLLRGDNLLCIHPDSPLYGYSLRAYHLFTTRNIKQLLSSNGFKVIKIVNEKQTVPKALTIFNTLKRLRILFTMFVSAVSFGKVHIGSEITIYATPKDCLEVDDPQI